MASRKEKIVLGISVFLFLFVLAFPFLKAEFSSGPNHVFGGMLFNPIDGNSYLAKMRQGYEGAWTFVLPYSPDPGEGAPINLYYLFLGQLSRWAGWSLIFTFHFARMIGSAVLFFALFNLSAKIFEKPAERWGAFLLASLGSGMGWLAIPFNIIAPDFWLSEAYPFLSGLANAHFPMGLALQIMLLSPKNNGEQGEKKHANWLYFSGGLALAIIYPFGLMLLGGIFALQLISQFIKNSKSRRNWKRAISTMSGGGIILIIQYWLVRSHPILDQWNSQNITPSPDLLILMLALSPAFIIMLLAMPNLWKSEKRNKLMPLLLWLFAALLLAYFPSNLQRRLLSGIYIPVAFLAMAAIGKYFKENKKKTLAIFTLILLSIPSQVMLLLSAMGAIEQKDSAIFLSNSEMDAMQWLESYAEDSGLVAASPESGLFLPVYSGVEVFYGHPFESIDAQKWEENLLALFMGEILAAPFFDAHDVDFVFYGPREKELGQLLDLAGWQAIYDEGGIQILEKIE